METDFKQVLNYLNDESIKINKSEFLFQAKSHPDYPSLLAIADTLTFLGVDNGSMRVNTSDIDRLPDRFIALLAKDHRDALYYVKRIEDHYELFDGEESQTIQRNELVLRWLDIVFLVAEDGSASSGTKPSKRSTTMMGLLTTVCLAVGLVAFGESDPGTYLFLVLSLVGFILSLMAKKDLFGGDIELINKFCNLSESSDCEAVTNSKKWKIFEYVDFGDLSLIFFTSQLLTLIAAMGLSGDVTSTLDLQRQLLYLSVPMVGLSIYYQRFVEGKWCPICLSISLLVISQLIYTSIWSSTSLFALNGQEMLFFFWVTSSVSVVWFLMKQILTQLRDLKEFELNANRYLRNYEPFRLSLLAQERIEKVESPITFGQGHKLDITVVTNPFCGNCREVDAALKRIVLRYPEDLKVTKIIKSNFELDTPDTVEFLRTLMAIYLYQGPAAYMAALEDFYGHGNVEQWLLKYAINNLNLDQIDSLYRKQNDWCLQQDISFTPKVFINGYHFPRSFDINNLEYYIPDLLEDEVIGSSVFGEIKEERAASLTAPS